MTHPLVAALEGRFQDVRNNQWSLNRRLQAIADEVRTKSPDFATAVDHFVARLAQAEAGAGAPAVGEVMPDFAMPDQDGRIVRLSEIVAEGPTVLAFHRGHWCPYCRLNMVGLAEIQDQLGCGRIYAISAEKQEHTRALQAESGARFPFLTDVDAGYVLSINLAIWVDEFMSSLIAGAGWDVPGYQGGQAWILPVPSVFIIDRSGIIRRRHVDPDYRQRMELDSIVEAVSNLDPNRQ
ncbi:MAG: peroxiredoxin [Erythrobacter sp. RIFCSPHIGHO2_12_FULL_63_10]|nr:MAG: peroxiredoxin [Erythrobacter sp. RIFCSPHIGHO2_12_FULL_63_10]